MNCPKCNQELKSDSRFCTACGQPIELLETVRMSGDRPLEVAGLGPAATPPAQSSRSYGKVIVLVAIFVVGLLTLIVVAVLLFGPKSTSSELQVGVVQTESGPIGGSLRAPDNSPVVQKILGVWHNRTQTLELKFQNSPTGIEGVISKVPGSWPKDRVKVGDSVFVKGKVAGDTIEGLYVNLPQNNDCQNLETRYSKCVISFDSESVMKVTNSAWKYSFPECKWSLVTYDDTWNWFKK